MPGLAGWMVPAARTGWSSKKRPTTSFWLPRPLLLHPVRKQKKPGILDTTGSKNDEARRHGKVVARERPDPHAGNRGRSLVGLDPDRVGVEIDPQIVRFRDLLAVDLPEANRMNANDAALKTLRVERDGLAGSSSCQVATLQSLPGRLSSALARS